jgi:6-pyruvoyl-tetrahydropterin synthase
MFIKLRHNMEIAHRLFLLPGKCQQIHGHSMQVELILHGHPNADGIFEGLDFSDVKRRFRAHLDVNYDHHLLLNKADPWAQYLTMDTSAMQAERLPGLVAVNGDPTTENIVGWLGQWALAEFKLPCDIYVQETGTNGVGRSYK